MINRRLQLALWVNALLRFEVNLRTEMAKIRNIYIRSAANQYEENHGHLPNWLLNAHKKNIKTALWDHYTLVIPHFGTIALNQVKSQSINRKTANNIFTSFMYEWIRIESLRKASMIASTDQSDVLNAIQSGIDAGDGISVIASSIRNITGMTPFRADTIARTETHNAATFGSVESARSAEQDLGIQLVKAWLPTLDDRTRPAHRAMEGQEPIPLGERFIVGGEAMDRPGDPSANPDNVINCRCALAYEENQ